MIDRVLDRFLPTRNQPAPVMNSVAETTVLIDRGIAAAIDLVICYVLIELPVVYVLSEVVPEQFDSLGGTAVVLSVVVLLPIYVTYSFACEWIYGRTPGKVNRGLMVAMATGEACTMRASAVRNLLRYVDLVGIPPLVVGLVSAFLADGRRIGDVIAGTVVARARAPASVRSAATAGVETTAAGRAPEREPGERERRERNREETVGADGGRTSRSTGG